MVDCAQRRGGGGVAVVLCGCCLGEGGVVRVCEGSRARQVRAAHASRIIINHARTRLDVSVQHAPLVAVPQRERERHERRLLLLLRVEREPAGRRRAERVVARHGAGDGRLRVQARRAAAWSRLGCVRSSAVPAPCETHVHARALAGRDHRALHAGGHVVGRARHAQGRARALCLSRSRNAGAGDGACCAPAPPRPAAPAPPTQNHAPASTSWPSRTRPKCARRAAASRSWWSRLLPSGHRRKT